LYASSEEYEWEMLPRMKLVSYLHTFETIAESLFPSGLVIERILEARAPDSVKEQFPNLFVDTRNFPNFSEFRTRHA